jgi:fatty-acyl-CoA synthase
MTLDTAASLPWVWDQTIGSVLERTAQRYSDRDALVFPDLGLRWSWRELDEQVDRVATSLIRLGVGRGENVGIWSMNVPEWVVAQFAVGRIGAVLVNVNPAYRVHELRDALTMADVSTLIVGAPFKGSSLVQMVETLCPEVPAATTADRSCARFPRLRRLIALDDRPGPGWWTWSDLVAGDESSRAELKGRVQSARATDVYNIQITSGTTGLPKGAMLTHRNVLMNAYYTGQRLRYSAEDRVCVPVPFYHCFGCVLGTLVCAVYGATMVVPAPAPDPEATLAAIAKERCTSVYGVPAMFVAMLEHPDFPSRDLSSLRTGIMAGAPCPVPLMEKVVNRMGAREVCIGYGQTEASPIITFTSADDPVEVRCGTVGKPIPGIEVKLIDPATRSEIPPDQPGELCARGHAVMAGYYKNPEATARAIDAEGWLHTGDLARQRADGNYRIVGRSKEQVNRGGEKIYPAEVEEFLNRHPAVSEVAVAGLPDAKYGEVVAAWVVPKSGATVTPEELKRYCQGQIAHFKIPQYIVITQSLPRTVTGKMRKHVLQEQSINEEAGPGSEPEQPVVIRRHTDVSFPAKVRVGKIYNLRVRLVSAEAELPGGGVRELAKPHTHDTTINLLISQPRPGLPKAEVWVSVSVAGENFEVEGPARAEIVVPPEGNSTPLQFALRGLEPGPGRIMIDFAQHGRPVGSVDLYPEIIAAKETTSIPVGFEPAVGEIELTLGSRPTLERPDIVLKVFEHRLAGHPGRLQFVLSSTHQALRDLPVLDGDLGTLDLKADLSAWVSDQLQAVGVLAGLASATSSDVARTLRGVGCNLFQQLIPPALQDLCWTFRKRGVRTILVLSDDPHIPWELIRPFRTDPATGAITAEDAFWGESYALTHWLRGRPPVPRLILRQVVAIAAGGGVPSSSGPNPGETAQPVEPTKAVITPTEGRPRRDMIRADSTSTVPAVTVPCGEPPTCQVSSLSNLPALASAEAELSLLRVLEPLGARIHRLPARRDALRQAFDEGAFDLLHLASHGAFGETGIEPVLHAGAESRTQTWPTTADASAVLLDDGIFTAAELVPQMAGPLRHRSPLVFFNTCHSGRVGFALTRIGAWGGHLVRMGCGAFIGALWPVTDQGALVFTQAFYELLAQWYPIGEAVRVARERLRDQFPNDPTWLAYRCFADPMARVEVSQIELLKMMTHRST